MSRAHALDPTLLWQWAFTYARMHVHTCFCVHARMHAKMQVYLRNNNGVRWLPSAKKERHPGGNPGDAR